ncbi:MAG: tRNA-dihydrouridine synthase [Candidatus Babeliales bacterium]|nr:tRNA-dihydrouridine synthase [Candidatus Babeliales bacterium]
MSYWSGKIKIGDKEYPRFIGGPLDGITDAPFRKLVREFSPQELLYTEMRHVACVSNPTGGAKALKFEQMERPLNFQVAANSINFIEQACEKIVAAGVEMVDLNIGCPARNVVGSSSGSALMADLPRLKDIVTLFRKVLPCPFTVKMRAGFKEVNAIEVAKMLQDCGVDAIAIHPRTRTQMFEGRPDYALAAQVKQAVSIPVIISGGVVNWATAKLVYEQTGVDGYLIGRGIWSRPWKLKELGEHSLGNPYAVDTKIVLHCALKHLDYMLDYYGPHGLFVFRKHLPFYIKGLPEASVLRERLVVAKTPQEVKEGLIAFLG